MWISKRTDYATRAVLALALADVHRPMKLGELARRTAVPQSVLEQIMPGDAEGRNRPLGARHTRRLPTQPAFAGDHAGTRSAPFPGAARTDRLRDAESSRALPDECRVLIPFCLGRSARRDHQDARRNQLRGPRKACGRALARPELIGEPTAPLADAAAASVACQRTPHRQCMGRRESTSLPGPTIATLLPNPPTGFPWPQCTRLSEQSRNSGRRPG